MDLNFVEMLEMIGRIADLKYKTTSMNDMPLATKIEYVLDLIIPSILDQERKEVNIQQVEESQSDDDY